MRKLSQDAVRAVYLDSWLDSAEHAAPSTSNQPALSMPFQRWFKFKEAFAPSFVVETLQRFPYRPESCLDPFGGSGTTALACQFLGIEPITIEVNPFMADVIEAKLTRYNPAELRYTVRSVLRRAQRCWRDSDINDCFPGAPGTFVEPGEGRRWIFNRDVTKAIVAIRSEIDRIADKHHRRFLRVMLGSKLVELSNIRVNGKGRRYRSGWQKRLISGGDVFASFEEACFKALVDIDSFRRRQHPRYTVMRGDARELAGKSRQVDCVLTSPPYPNSFDYTDIYNLELWTLGYLQSGKDNRQLRESTVRSHVQIAHHGEPVTSLSPRLAATYRALKARRKHLWNSRIPEMVCHYFEDMRTVLKGCHSVLTEGGNLVMAVGDSRYDGVHIDVAKIIAEIAQEVNFRLIRTEAVRSMRSSAQQGGRHVLKESLVWLSS